MNSISGSQSSEGEEGRRSASSLSRTTSAGVSSVSLGVGGSDRSSISTRTSCSCSCSWGWSSISSSKFDSVRQTGQVNMRGRRRGRTHTKWNVWEHGVVKSAWRAEMAQRPGHDVHFRREGGARWLHVHIQQSGMMGFPDVCSNARSARNAVVLKPKLSLPKEDDDHSKRNSLKSSLRLPPNLNAHLHSLIHILQPSLIIHAHLQHIPIPQLTPFATHPRPIQKRPTSRLGISY